MSDSNSVGWDLVDGKPPPALARLRGDSRRLGRIAEIAARDVDCITRDLDAGQPDGARVMLEELDGLVSEVGAIGRELADIARELAEIGRAR